MAYRHGFTLVELLVVMAIISILAGLLLPVLQKARESAWQANSMSNEKQLCVVSMQYVDDHDGCFYYRGEGYVDVNSGYRFHTLLAQNYLGYPDYRGSENDSHYGVFNCPAMRVDMIYNGDPVGCNYGWNIWLYHDRLSGVQQVTKRVLWCDGQYFRVDGYNFDDYSERTNTVFGWFGACLAHHDGFNVGFLDAHVEYRNRTNPLTRLENFDPRGGN